MESRIIKILAIDDNQDNLITIQALVNESFPEFLILKALNGMQGLELASIEKPDVILLDVVMPEMDGYEVCIKLKEDKNLRDIPVIFVTALKGDKGSRIKALECGAEAFLAKPIDESELVAQIRAMVKIKTAHLERIDENIRLAALVAEQTNELKKTYSATLNLLEDLKNENEARKKTEEALRKSEEKFREMANLLPQIVFEINIDGIITYVNKQAYLTFGYGVDELIGLNSLIFHVSEEIPLIKENISLKISGKEVERKDYNMIHKDGTVFPALIYTSLVYEGAKIVGLRGIVIDITEQKLAEEKISHVARLYAFLSQINQAMVRTQSLEELFKTICEVAIVSGQFHMAWVGLIDESDNRIKPITWAGHNDDYLDQIIITTGFEIFGKGPTGTCFRERKIIYCNDIANDARMLPWKKEALKRGYKSLIAVPFLRKGNILGTLTLYATESDFFSADELRLLKEISDDISFAINAIDTENLRNQTEKALEHSRNELKTIYDHAPVMMCVVDTSRHILFANQAFSTLTGISQEEMIGGAVGGVVGCINSITDPRGCGFGPNCWNCSLRIAMDKTFNTGVGIQNIVYQSTLKIAGVNRDVSLLGSTAIIKNDDTSSLLLCLHDITDRMLTEDALQKSEMLLRTFIDNSPFEIWARDKENIGILENKKFVEHYGSIIGYTPNSDPRIEDETAQTWIKLNDRVLSGEIIDEEYIFKVGTENHVFQQIVFPIEINKTIIGFAGFNIDITDRKRIEKELNDQKQFFEQMFMQSSISTQILDRDGWCERINPKLSQLFGVEAPNMEGKVYNIFKDNEIKQTGILQKLENVFNNGETSEWEVLFDIGEASVSQDINILEKKKVWFHNWAYPIFNQNDDISHVIIQHDDITDRKLAEDALSISREQLKKFAAHLQNVREEERVLLAREIHDELGQILIAIKIDLGMLRQNVLKSIDKEHSEQVVPKFDTLFVLVDNTIKTARKIMTDLRPEMLDLLGFIETIKQHLSVFQERYKITCFFENSIDSLELDSQQSVALFRIIQEALNNVAKHSKATELRVIFELKEKKLSLEIVDNGIGFDENHKKNSDSYGLIGMKERVFLLDGQLTIKGKKNHGTSIKVVMPYYK